MKAAEMRTGRVFVLRLETGEHLKEKVEEFAAAHHIVSATITAVGGVQAGSRLVSGPQLPVGGRIDPIIYTVDAPSELTGTGTVFSDEQGKPVMHMHGSVGRNGRSVTGCFRQDIVAWLVLEVVITELVGNGPVRRFDPAVGGQVMQIE
ncbi:MAG: DNA-binding protein [Candidatus Methanomethylophilus sp.]|nr:DNA-binding protein [Methanomethylophilus sp.]MDD4222897.1 DNA-binding protein [Methanomethylophilus sp.]